VLYTDGMIEGRRDFFGEDRLKALAIALRDRTPTGSPTRR